MKEEEKKGNGLRWTAAAAAAEMLLDDKVMGPRAPFLHLSSGLLFFSLSLCASNDKEKKNKENIKKEKKKTEKK